MNAAQLKAGDRVKLTLYGSCVDGCTGVVVRLVANAWPVRVRLDNTNAWPASVNVPLKYGEVELLE